MNILISLKTEKKKNIKMKREYINLLPFFVYLFKRRVYRLLSFPKGFGNDPTLASLAHDSQRPRVVLAELKRIPILQGFFVLLSLRASALHTSSAQLLSCAVLIVWYETNALCWNPNRVKSEVREGAWLICLRGSSPSSSLLP